MVEDVLSLALNPKYCHCFADEDMVGKVARVCRMTHRALYAQRTMERFRAMMIQKLHTLR